MRNLNIAFSFLAVALLSSATLSAQATRTWVSGVGDDVNPCTRTAPCKTFAGAITKTSAGGEIDVLDPGGFGTLTITKALTIDGGSGPLASILAGAGGTAILIQAGSSDVVTIRNLSIQGAGVGLNGIRFVSGKVLHIQHCEIAQFLQHGVDMEPTNAGAQIEMTDSVSQDNQGNGFYGVGAGSYVFATIDNSRFVNNNNGVVASDYTKYAIRNSTASGNTLAGILALANSGQAVISIANSTSANNATGVQAGGGSAASAVRVSGVALFINANGFVALNNGTIASFGNNYNSGSGAPTAILPVQ